jgi:hypothetical protein
MSGDFNAGVVKKSEDNSKHAVGEKSHFFVTI